QDPLFGGVRGQAAVVAEAVLEAQQPGLWPDRLRNTRQRCLGVKSLGEDHHEIDRLRNLLRTPRRDRQVLDAGAGLKLKAAGVDRADVRLVDVDEYDLAARAMKRRSVETAHRACAQDQDFHCAASSIIPPPSSSRSFTSTALPRSRCSATVSAMRSSGTRCTTMSSCSVPPPSPTRLSPVALTSVKLSLSIPGEDQNSPISSQWAAR